MGSERNLFTKTNMENIKNPSNNRNSFPTNKKFGRIVLTVKNNKKTT